MAVLVLAPAALPLLLRRCCSLAGLLDTTTRNNPFGTGRVCVRARVRVRVRVHESDLAWRARAMRTYSYRSF